MRHAYHILFLSLIFLFVSCKQDRPVPAETIAKTAVKVPVVDGDRLYSLIEKQLSFGHRIPGTPEHLACRDWIVETLKSYGAIVELQPFKASFYDVKDADAFNIIASFNPEDTHRILLAAHYDTRMVAEKDEDKTKRDDPIMGADDGGSGVAGLLEIARVLSENPIDMGIDMIFFDAEDNGLPEVTEGWCLGSQYWAKNVYPKDYKAKFGILLDLIGAKGATFGKDQISQQFAKRYQDKIWTLAQRMGYSDLFIDSKFSVIDDHIYVNQAGIPMMDIINYNIPENKFGHYHHTHKDDISVIDKRTLRIVTQIVTTALYKESELSL